MSTNKPFQFQFPETHNFISDLVPVTPDNSNDNVGGGQAVGLYLTVAGDVTFLNLDGVSRTVTVPAFYTLLSGITRVMSTGTTATGIHALRV